MGVDHRRSHDAVAEQLLNHADGLAPLQQMRLTTRPHTRANGAGLLHLDDPERLRATASALSAPSLPIPSGSASGSGASGGCSAPSCLAPARAGGP
jgi:hypothetical protein